MATGPAIRRVRVQLNPEILRRFYEQGSKHHFMVTDGLPLDAKLVDSFLEVPLGMGRHHGILNLVLEHPSFDPIGMGQPIPIKSIGMEDLA